MMCRSFVQMTVVCDDLCQLSQIVRWTLLNPRLSFAEKCRNGSLQCSRRFRCYKWFFACRNFAALSMAPVHSRASALTGSRAVCVIQLYWNYSASRTEWRLLS